MSRDRILAALSKSLPSLRASFGVESIALFGSAARDELRPDSDIDLLVELTPDAQVGLFGFVRLQNHLSSMLGRPVDLATPGALKPQLKAKIFDEAIHAA
ncbi:MAG: nucleotidyltransferase family protein [Acidobacteriota bacterium]